VCAAVGALAVASTGAALAGEVLKLEIVALNDLRHGGAKEEVLPVVVQLHHARQQLGTSRGASAVNLPAPEKTDWTFVAADFLQPTSAK